VAEAGVPIEVPRRRFAVRWSLVPAAAFLALIVAVVAMSVSLYQANEAIDRQERAIAAIIQGPRGIDMKGPDAVAALVPTDSGSLFVASGLTEAPANKTYQLWLMDGDLPTSAGTFDVKDGLVIFETSKTITGFSGAAVTIEPEGGSPAPTGVQVVNSF
jgi:anti-sigma-K factor RskA